MKASVLCESVQLLRNLSQKQTSDLVSGGDLCVSFVFCLASIMPKRLGARRVVVIYL